MTVAISTESYDFTVSTAHKAVQSKKNLGTLGGLGKMSRDLRPR
jgi:hypothetical protein